MGSWGNAILTLVCGAGAVALLAGCSSADGGSTSRPHATSTIAPDVPARFDACKLPTEVVQTERLIKPETDTKDNPGGVKWRGCRWIQSDGFGASIDTTNLTLPMVRANKDFTVDEEATIGGRPSLTAHLGKQDSHTFCSLYVGMRGGSLELNINNPSSRKSSGTRHACDIAKSLAEGIAPAIPATA
ncbi:type IV pilus biogenesis protein CpaD/CtpE [Nocardia transvalensis]|uniref:Type IV pilus biogenesis protein CpaD/CtpE n=1 Tax=Nocardia transvalensis TaxID=37333 RepID=A0A7W9UFW8_9NOCA|nr:DUF3558 domain-containing protein [Nocardia transvalensis]MBB5911552.1 type IV pilus biogenesis protein CpaD/CtpE [Nocardia transvalensis]